MDVCIENRINSKTNQKNNMFNTTSNSTLGVTTSLLTGSGLLTGTNINGINGTGISGFTTSSPSTTITGNLLVDSLSLSQKNTNNQIMQNKVAVFKVTRDEDEKVVKTQFLKEMWVETKNGQSVDFQVARDKDLADYEMSDLVIKTILSVSF
jgi:hypothetical protein